MDDVSSDPIQAARSRVAALGAVFNPQVQAATAEIYAPLVRTSDPDVELIQDVAFGAHPRQKLDVYHPTGGRTGLPVIVFIPGGGFIGGGKNEHPAFHRNVGVYFAGHGFVAVIANYRLAPEFTWPDQTSDVALAVEWALAHAADYGGDPGRVSAIGQSAGAANLSAYLFHPRYQGRAEKAGLRSAVLMSGVYRFDDSMPPNVRQYAGAPGEWEDRSPISHVSGSRLPVMLCVAELDPAFLAAPTLELAHAVTWRDGHCPPLIRFDGHNHVSTVQSLGSGDDSVGGVLRRRLAQF